MATNTSQAIFIEPKHNKDKNREENKMGKDNFLEKYWWPFVLAIGLIFGYATFTILRISNFFAFKGFIFDGF